MITEGIRPDGSAMLPRLPYRFLINMIDENLDATIRYLRVVPPRPSPE